MYPIFVLFHCIRDRNPLLQDFAIFLINAIAGVSAVMLKVTMIEKGKPPKVYPLFLLPQQVGLYVLAISLCTTYLLSTLVVMILYEIELGLLMYQILRNMTEVKYSLTGFFPFARSFIIVSLFVNLPIIWHRYDYFRRELELFILN